MIERNPLPVDLKKHVEFDHDRNKPLHCNICPKKFTESQILKKHIATVHKETNPCPICDRGFLVEHDLKKHVEFVHEGKKPVQSNICPKKFTESCSFKKHIVTVHEIAKSCEINL